MTLTVNAAENVKVFEWVVVEKAEGEEVTQN